MSQIQSQIGMDGMLTRKDLAARWNVCTETIKRREKVGALPFVAMGPRLKRYRLSDVLRLEAQMHVEAGLS